MNQNLSPKSRAAAALFWHLLFFDMYFMGWRYGGISVISVFLHGCCITLAALVLLAGGRTRPIPRLYWWMAGLVVAVAGFQLLPLPGSLFPALAPVKHKSPPCPCTIPCAP